MAKVTLQNLGTIVREKRGNSGLRQVARDIGTSPATLSRVEAGKMPDITTFGKLCRWLGVDAGRLLGIENSGSGLIQEPSETAVAHMRAQKEIAPTTAGSLASVIIKAQRMLADSPEENSGERL